jgi:N-acetylmuramoyl-L-alanine amidase
MARVRSAFFTAAVSATVLLTVAPAYAAAPPTTVTGRVARAGSTQVALSWANPADADFAGVSVVSKPGTTAPAGLSDGARLDVAAAGHTATVTGLTNNAAYSFAVFTRNTAGDVSDPATVTRTQVPALVTKLSISLAPSTVTYGAHPVVTATLVRGDTGEPVADAKVDLYRKPYASAYAVAYHLTTNSAGVVSTPTSPAKNTDWYALHPADPYFGRSYSDVVTSTVRTAVHVSRAPAVVEQNSPSNVAVYVVPSHAYKKVYLQRWVDGGWRGAGEAVLNGRSMAVFPVKTSVISTKTYRVFMAADNDHAWGASTNVAITTVRRTLRSGMSGADVLAAQKRLAALHYDVGSVNGVFGYDSVHATAAFQKVNGLAVNGTVDPATYARLASPRAPKLLHPQAGTVVEVDLTKQVLYYARDGVVTRILDISSGSGRLFTVDGETQRAVTPTGSFRIFHKIDGMRVSRLGSLWRPAYFASGGYAIHGNSSVPFYPASHGCVRITNSAMNRLFSMLTIGMRVYVYRS